ncbi:MAG TPA: DUF1428 family protein [Burkholderiales bacterium]|nr:DUF1428 family protein [Burkholderiales bacterium]
MDHARLGEKPSLDLSREYRSRRTGSGAHGALEYKECVADDVTPGKWTSFRQAVKLRRGELMWFSWTT